MRPSYWNCLRPMILYPSMQIGRVRWSVRLSTLVLFCIDSLLFPVWNGHLSLVQSRLLRNNAPWNFSTSSGRYHPQGKIVSVAQHSLGGFLNSIMGFQFFSLYMDVTYDGLHYRTIYHFGKAPELPFGKISVPQPFKINLRGSCTEAVGVIINNCEDCRLYFAWGHWRQYDLIFLWKSSP